MATGEDIMMARGSSTSAHGFSIVPRLPLIDTHGRTISPTSRPSSLSLTLTLTLSLTSTLTVTRLPSTRLTLTLTPTSTPTPQPQPQP
eukprot:scaffold135907_cov54-Phaeocystis_antarctica.AAC.1